MSTAEEGATGSDQAEVEDPKQPTKPNGEEDWKAKYEALVPHSRDWEKKAKANKEAADKLAALEQDKQTDSEKIAQLEKRLNEKEQAEARATIAAKVAKEKGVPVDLIVGDDEEEMSAWAEKLKAAMTPNPAAKVDKPGSFDRGDKGGDDPMRNVVKQLFGN